MENRDIKREPQHGEYVLPVPAPKVHSLTLLGGSGLLAQSVWTRQPQLLLLFSSRPPVWPSFDLCWHINMKSQDLKKFNLPDNPGVYYFLAPRTKNPKPRILYIGKATSLKDRVKSYFAKDTLMTRGPRIEKMIQEATKIDFIQTDSVLEALILEANEIKKHQPIYNSKEKDDKSYNYVTMTDEEFPKIHITRGSGTYGPFPYGSELREALKIVRKIFPYRDNKCKLSGRPCFNAQIGLCPGPCAGWVTRKEYGKTLKHLKLFFEAKKPRLIESLEKEMKTLAKAQKFEEAEKIKRKIFALDHIQDIALIKEDVNKGIFDSFTRPGRAPTLIENSFVHFRIEAYDIAHMSGKDVVGVMTVISDGELDRSQYRKFRIRNDSNDDVNNLREILSRRLNHPEWPIPNLIVVDGGTAQHNVAKEITKIPVVAVTKDERHKAREILGSKEQVVGREKEILLANAEAHRFAIGYHRKLRGKGFRI